MVNIRKSGFVVGLKYRTLSSDGVVVVLQYRGKGVFEDVRSPGTIYMCDIRHFQNRSQCAIHHDLEAFFSSERATDCAWVQSCGST